MTRPTRPLASCRIPVVVVLLVGATIALGAFGAGPARAAETDQYYSWYVRVPDATEPLDERINKGFAEALREVNAASPESLSCGDVALRMLDKQFRTAVWFVVGATKDWGFPYRPASTTEFQEQYEQVSLYRYFGLFPFGVLIPVDPTVRVGDVYLGTDKIGHFLTNGPRYWQVYTRTREQGATVDDALQAAVDLGIEQEAGILGGVITSTFSYGDLEANFQGLELVRSWCEGGGLVLADGEEHVVQGERTRGKAWRLTRPFSMKDWVNPCWDESFYPNAYSGPTAAGVKKALQGYCRLRTRPDIAARRRLYREAGCHSFSVKYLDERIAQGKIPDPAPFTLERACGDPPAR